MDVVLETFENVKAMLASGDGPILVHALTTKGYGYLPAQNDPYRYHGVGRFDVESGEFHRPKPGPPKYQRIFADTLIRLAREDRRIVGITAAMADGTGLDRFAKEFPERFYDVGIAEQHAITFAAGLATEGMKPVAAIYSTFLQRAYDQIVHDVCLQNLDVTLAMDRAGIVGADGATHQGMYDISYLRHLPNMICMAPKDENELQHMLRTAIEYDGPAAVRYPRGAGFGVPLDPELKSIPIGESELLRDGDDALIVAYGTLAHPALEAAAELAAEGISAAVVNARFAKPLDRARILPLASRCKALVTVEEHSSLGGFGSAVLEALSAAGVMVASRCLGVPDWVVEHGEVEEIRRRLSLDAEGIAQAVRDLVERPASEER
jgi:1-deoxy-D-xylulose-5-phosphate synthase